MYIIDIPSLQEYQNFDNVHLLRTYVKPPIYFAFSANADNNAKSASTTSPMPYIQYATRPLSTPPPWFLSLVLEFVVLRRRRLLSLYTAHGWRPHLHPVYTFLLLYYLPNLVLLGACQYHQRAPVGSIPAMLSVLILERIPLSTAQPLSISR